MLSNSPDNNVDSSVDVETSHQDFWRRQFPHPVELVLLPLDNPRPPTPSYVRNTAELSLTSSASNGLRDLSSRLNAPPLAVLIAAFSTVLFRYARQETLVVGAVAQASGPADEFVRKGFPLLPIRASASLFMEVSGDELARELARCLAEAEAHAGYSLRELQSWAGVPDAAFGYRLFNVALCLAEESSRPAYGWPMSDPDLSEFIAQCDVSITVMPTASGITLQADYDIDLFEKSTIDRLLGHLSMILEGMIQHPSCPVLRLPILTAVERQQLLVEWNTSKARIPSYGTLHQWFEAQVARTPDAVALTHEGRSLTYQELNQRANRLAHALHERGVGSEVIVGLCLDRSLELVISLLAILKAGGAYLPIDLAYPKERLAFMLEDTRAPFLVTQSRLAADLPVNQAQVICVDDADLSEFQLHPTSNCLSGATAESLAYVIYTSGTTGKSKGALIRHQNVTRLFTATEPWYGFNERDVWTLFHSTAFDFSVWEIWGALLYGGRVVVVPFMISRSPEAFYELLARERVTVLNQTPSAFRQLIQAEETVGQRDLALRYVIFGGEALEIQSLRPWFERHGDQEPRLVNMYGITETTVHVTYRPLSKNDLESGSVIGVPIPDLQIYILDGEKQPVPIGVAGEMYVGGAGLARGYLSRPELTAERFIPDHLTSRPGSRLYKTGDLARFLPGRDIEYLGRIDHQVKIRGFRIELGEIESVLCQHAMVREAVVMAREDTPGVKSLAAYLVTSLPVP
ncbi:MAG: amino acid adenylation domain-containing protein, partial [Pyrinomonadaceae bacterium]|nr:amino acid adenylation domain-containing protein [Pyrinomonadaceae bacterium]